MIKIDIIIKEENKIAMLTNCSVKTKTKRKLPTKYEKLIENKIYENFDKLGKGSIKELIKSH